MIELKKGTIIKESYNFVVVKIGFDGKDIFIFAMDCHANNSYVLSLTELINPIFIDPSLDKDVDANIMSVVGEVLSGQHDDRW